MTQTAVPALALDNIGKAFGSVRALEGVNLKVHPGRVVAIMGHNGAGKSTLMHILAGTLRPSSGTVALFGEKAASPTRKGYLPGDTVRCVFQELSLCPNLTVVENTRLALRGLPFGRWRARARDLILKSLDDIFPDHGIDPAAKLEDLPIGSRQMVEIARAFATTGEPVRVVILDEPTSSLGGRRASQLLAYMRKASQAGATIFFISHRMDEIFGHTDEIVVMRDGQVIAHRPTSEFTHDSLVSEMGMVEIPADPSEEAASTKIDTPVVVRVGDFVARKGTVVGLAGLDGHGQKDLLNEIYLSSRRPVAENSLEGTFAFVAGDRQSEGIFPLWSIARNISAGRSTGPQTGKSVSLAREIDVAQTWQTQLSIRAPDVNTPISALSGGNQQKVLVARAFAQEAEIILLDDPLRGVDVGTKRELYAFIRDQARAGKTFIWYSTEIAELENCDIVYVYYQGRISAVVPREELSEHRILEASFGRNPDTPATSGKVN